MTTNAMNRQWKQILKFAVFWGAGALMALYEVSICLGVLQAYTAVGAINHHKLSSTWWITEWALELAINKI